MLKIVEEGILSKKPGRGAYMPIITPLSDGLMISCQHVGRLLGSTDNHIVILRSTDNGKTWVDEGSIHGGLPKDGYSYRGPEINEVPDGRLLMVATRFETEVDQLFDPDSEALKPPALVLFWSSDRGRTWSSPQVIGVPLPPEKYTCNGAGRFLQMAPDRWLYFLETWKPEGYVGPPDQKAALIVSHDQGQSWGGLTIVADDPTGRMLYWDQMGCVLPDGRIYDMFWTHRYGTREDFPNHWSFSEDQGRTWSKSRPTNLRGQVSSPIPLPDGRVAAVYNYRHEPQGIHVAISKDLEEFDLDNEVTVFDAGAEATLGTPKSDQFFEEHNLIGFGKPAGHLCDDGTLLTYFWCTSGGVAQTRWVKLSV